MRKINYYILSFELSGGEQVQKREKKSTFNLTKTGYQIEI